MELNENLTTSLNLVTKYEIYRIIKLYAYLFVLASILLGGMSLFDTSSFLYGISLYIYLALFTIPMVYSFIVYFVIKSKTPNFEFEISFSRLIFPVLCILTVLFLFPAIVYILMYPFDLFSIIIINSPAGALYILFPSSFSLIINFFFLKRLQPKSNSYVFIITGIILFLIWIAELFVKMYTIMTILYIIIGIILYLYSIIYLKR